MAREAPIGPQLDERKRLTEIVQVQLEKSREQPGIARRSYIENDFQQIRHVNSSGPPN
jgi:hypothetical protein